MSAKVAVVGDAFLEEFRPVRKKNDTTVKARVPVYETEPAYDHLRTHSPGGSAFLATLLVPLADAALISVPAHPGSSLADMLAAVRCKAKTPPDLFLLPADERPSRIQGFYSRDSDGRWQLATRCDEMHALLPYKSLSFPETKFDFLVLDDHSRGAVSSQLIADIQPLRSQQIIISAQYEHAQLYDELKPNHDNTVVVCTDRQALLWTGIESPPPRFPPGTPRDHLSLFRRIYYGMRDKLPWAHDFLVTCSSPFFSCLQFTAEGDGCIIKYYSASADVASDEDPMLPPGITSFFLASIVAGLMKKLPMEAVIDLAVSAAAAYGADGVQPRDRWFGRLEKLLPAGPSLVRRPSLVGSIDKINPKIWEGAQNLLEHAQVYGHLPKLNSALPDYFAPSVVDKKISALVDALISFVTRPNRKRPFNILVTADPGSGKSFFAQCLAKRLDIAAGKGRSSTQHPLIETNLSLVEESESTYAALNELYEEVRDQRALGRIPVVLIDEFDALMPIGADGEKRPDEMDRLFARMLAPLWDGLFVLNGRYRRLGGFILLVAASSPAFLKRLDKGEGKARDFASRIDVRLELPDLLALKKSERLEPQVRMAVAMLKKHMGGAVRRVELAVLDAIGRAEFPRRNRAIDQLIMLSSSPVDGTFRIENLPKGELLEHFANSLSLDASELRYGRSWVPIHDDSPGQP